MLLVCMTAQSALFSISSSMDVEPEYHKTVILFKILQFVTFPDNENKNIDIICYGEDPMIRSIEDLASSYLISGRRITVRQVHSIDSLKASGKSDLIFISGNEESALPEILEQVRVRKILSIGNGNGFAEKGVHINIFTHKSKVSFEINRSEVEKSGIYLSSKLYKLARIIE
mgnify:CR=1 FL=1